MTQTFQVKEGQTEITVPHQDSTLTCIHPYQGPGTYVNVAQGLQERNLRQPTLTETASLAYAALQNKGDKYADEIIQLMKQRWLWGFTGILYIPDDGAYIQDNPAIEDNRVVMNLDELKQDETVRHVPFGYSATCQMSPEELTENPFAIGLAGEKGAKTLVNIARQYPNQSRLWALTDVDEQQIRVAALSSRGGDWLDVSGLNHDGNYDGCSFGVRE